MKLYIFKLSSIIIREIRPHTLHNIYGKPSRQAINIFNIDQKNIKIRKVYKLEDSIYYFLKSLKPKDSYLSETTHKINNISYYAWHKDFIDVCLEYTKL